MDKQKTHKGSKDERHAVSAGVEQLIERLREQGVQKGQAQAAKIVKEANIEATQRIAEAKREAAHLIEQAQKEAEQIKTAGTEALRIAARDAILEMRDVLMQRFVRDVERLVSRELRDETFLKRCILEIIRRTCEHSLSDPGQELEILLPRDVVGLEELRRKPEELEKGTLSQFTLAVADDILREGVRFQSSQDQTGGICVRLKDKHVDIDLSDRAIARFLLQHLEPRFRAMLEGIVR